MNWWNSWFFYLSDEAFSYSQIFALFIRPKKEHKYRHYWNIYHHSIGYTVIILGIINIFRGFDILSPEKKWKSAYIIVIAVLGGIALLLEVITWIVVLRRKSSKSTKPFDGYNNGQSRQQPLAAWSFGPAVRPSGHVTAASDFVVALYSYWFEMLCVFFTFFLLHICIMLGLNHELLFIIYVQLLHSLCGCPLFWIWLLS